MGDELSGYSRKHFNRKGSIDWQILAMLNSSRDMGAWQFELERSLNFSKSHISDTLRKLEAQGKIVRRREGGKVIRVWLTKYYPYPLKNVLRIWMLRAYEYLPLLYSIFSVFGKAGYTIHIYPGNHGQEVARALTSGYADIAFLPAVTSIIISYSSNSTVILTGVASGCSGILENEFSASETAATTNASSMYALTSLRFNKTARKIRIFNKISTAMNEFIAGKFKYIALWEPYFTKCLKNKGVAIDSTYDQLLDSIPCCTVSTNTFFLSGSSSLISTVISEYSSFNQDTLKSISQSPLLRKICSMVFDEELIDDVPFDPINMRCRPFSGDLRRSLEIIAEKLGIPIDPHLVSKHIYQG